MWRASSDRMITLEAVFVLPPPEVGHCRRTEKTGPPRPGLSLTHSTAQSVFLPTNDLADRAMADLPGPLQASALPAQRPR